MKLNTGTFFKDKYGVDSMPALLLFLSFWPATYVMVVNHTENLYYAYMAAYAGLAANKQWATRGNTNQMADDEPIQPVQVVSDSGGGASVNIPDVASVRVEKRRTSVQSGSRSPRKRSS